MLPLSIGRLLLPLITLIAMVSSIPAYTQDDSNDPPLGDVARNLRKQNAAKPVIDDDNLSQAIEHAEDSRPFGSSFRYLMAGEFKGFQVSAPDVTCSLSFTANVKSLLSGQYAEMDLPPAEIARIQAQATIEGDTLTVPVFNGTDWHVSELAIALMVVRKKNLAGVGSTDYVGAADVTPNPIVDDPLDQVRAEKKPDATMLYRMRTASPPWERVVFSAPLNIDLPPDAEWHWAIVQAKGYPPESYAAQRRASEKRTDNPAAYVPSSLTDIQNPLAVTPQ